jgi:hypothetical protein
MLRHQNGALSEWCAIRQMLGHGELPQFVGSLSKALYQSE